MLIDWYIKLSHNSNIVFHVFHKICHIFIISENKYWNGNNIINNSIQLDNETSLTIKKEREKNLLNRIYGIYEDIYIYIL